MNGVFRLLSESDAAKRNALIDEICERVVLGSRRRPALEMEHILAMIQEFRVKENE